MNEKTPIYKDTTKSFEERVDDLVSRLSIKEKILHLTYKAPGNKKLGIPPYDWWNECLHGVGRAGIATVFPQAIGLAATFNMDLIFEMARIISDEARAKHHEFFRNNEFGRYKGLTFWSPNINIFRDPRWGRGQETYGEDPYLTAKIGVAFVKGLQGNDPKYLKVVATPKHYAVHSGPEKDRHRFNAIVSLKDLRETYLPHFKECVVDGKAYSVMGAYNRTNNEACCASPTLLQKILREEWGFQGYVVSDCGAIRDIHRNHKITASPEESAALAVKTGCDLDCGITFRKLKKALKKKLVSEADIDKSVKRLFMARFKLGMFDPPEMVPYAQIPFTVNDCEKHRQFALKVARETIVLLKNEQNLLPLKKGNKKIAVIGPNADNLDSLLGNYNGTPSKYVTPLQGIRNKLPNAEIQFAEGCKIVSGSEDSIDTAVKIAENSDIVIACMGISPKYEGEERIMGSDDRKSLDLPEIQQQLLKKLNATGKPIVLIFLNGSPISSVWAQYNIPAIIEAWYPGEEGGTAIADVLFGDYSPAGRLPITIVKSHEDLPPFEDYSMKGRTYRYLEKEPLYPFGYGLSYSKFKHSNLSISAKTVNIGEPIKISVDIENIGEFDSDEVVQLYLKDMDSSVRCPIVRLEGFKRLCYKKGSKTNVKFEITPRQMAVIDDNGDQIIEPGRFKIYIGGSQPDQRSKMLVQSEPLEAEFEVIGQKTKIKY